MADIEKLFTEHKNFIYKFLLKLCKNESLAEELTQETFFRAYINLSRLKNEDKAPVWLCQIAKNAYFVWYNEHKKLHPLEESGNIEDSQNVDDMVFDKEMTDDALRCLRELDEPYKEVFALAVFGQISLKEISEIFGKSESWARVTFYRAKQKIIERMRWTL